MPQNPGSHPARGRLTPKKNIFNRQYQFRENRIFVENQYHLYIVPFISQNHPNYTFLGLKLTQNQRYCDTNSILSAQRSSKCDIISVKLMIGQYLTPNMDIRG